MIAVCLLEAGMVWGLAAVVVSLRRCGVNGPCCVSVGLLVAWRISVLVGLQASGPAWSYLWGTLFGYAFLYSVHHLARVVTLVRRHAASYRCLPVE
jgi:hypothetical protein